MIDRREKIIFTPPVQDAAAYSTGGDHISLGTQRLFMSFNRSAKKLKFF